MGEHATGVCECLIVYVCVFVCVCMSLSLCMSVAVCMTLARAQSRHSTFPLPCHPPSLPPSYPSTPYRLSYHTTPHQLLTLPSHLLTTSFITSPLTTFSTLFLTIQMDGATGEGASVFFQCNALETLLKRFLTEEDSLNNSSIRSGFISLVTCVLSNPSSGSGSSNGDSDRVVATTISALLRFLDDMVVYLQSALPWTVTGSANGGKKSAHTSPGVIAKRVCDAIRGIHQITIERKMEADRVQAESVRAGVPLTAQMLQQSLSVIDSQVAEITDAQDMLNTDNKMREDQDKEKAQFQRVFIMREMSLDKAQLLLEVRSAVTYAQYVQYM